MRSRTWFLLSLMLFIAAAFFWKQAEERRSLRQTSKKHSAISEKKAASDQPAGPSAAASSAKNILPEPKQDSSTTNSTNAVVLYPHRLQNTTQTLGQLVRNEKAILLRNALIDTSAEGVKIPDELRAKGDPGSYIVQARGVVDVTFRAALSEANAEIISYVPNNAYLVRLQSGGASTLKANKRVQSVLPYEPYYKLDTDLLAAVMEKKDLGAGKPLRVTLFPGQLDSAVEALRGKGRIIDEDLKSSPFGPELIVASVDLVQLANLPQVQGVEPFYEREKLNDLTRVRLGISEDTETPLNYLNLSGSNIWVNVNDSTIDEDHPDLTPRVTIGVGDGTDEDGHGTHVAGIIASSGLNSPTGGSLTNLGSVAGANFRGAAPGALIFSLDIFAPSLSDARMQETAATHSYIDEDSQSALISNNSWGYGTRSYNSSAASFDAAVRDALPGSIGSQPITYVFAAGNSGSGNNNGQGGFPGTVVSPATAKNVISVGAIENLRNITNEVTRPDAACETNTTAEFFDATDSQNQVAGFSSRGNVGVSQEGPFGRLKPDVVAPGTWIASTRSGQFDEASYYSPLHVDGSSFPGLVIDPTDTNFFSIFVPDDPCDAGAVLTLTINAIVTGPAATNPLPLLIYTGNAPRPSNTGTLRGVDSVTMDRTALPLDNVLYYDIVNTNDVEITYTLQTRLVLSNDFGNYFEVVSNLNATLAPNYMFESGTSMAAPAISGMLALMQEFFETRFQVTNSPAMMKALLINSSRSIGPQYTYERERSLNSQGWGLPNLQRILSANPDTNAWPIRLFDQSTNSSLATGEQHDRVVTVTDTDSPLRVTLVWTDPPGNPAVGVKLVNDLDLIVTGVVTNFGSTTATTNVYVGNNFPGGEFTQSSESDTNGLVDFELVRDSVNNVENVYINGPVGAQYTISVVGRRVNVNAVTAHAEGIVQDYALVISNGEQELATPMTVSPVVAFANSNPFVTVITNGLPILNQRVGANSPLQNVKPDNLTDGTPPQWRFYVLNNPSGFTNIAFMTFLPPNLSGALDTVPGSRRIIEADVDMYVSTNASLTNLNPAAIAGADKSLTRGGQELIFYTNRNDPVFYIGIKSEDQRAAEFSFFAIATDTPFSEEDANGNLILNGILINSGIVPDGSPDSPGNTFVSMIATKPINVGRVIVTNSITHERIGDLITTLTHTTNAVTLLNHSFPNGQESGTFVGIYDDSGLTDGDGIPGSRKSDGPGSLTDFVGTEAFGEWRLTVDDNALNSTGKVDYIRVFIEKGLETNELADGSGFIISETTIPGGQSRGLTFEVPANATNMIISLSPKEGAIDAVVRRGRLVPTRNPYVDKGALISPPGGKFNVDFTDTPPLTPGRYSLRLFNDGGDVTVSGEVRFELDLAARSLQTYSGGLLPLLDDAMTNSIIHVDRDALVTSVEVGVRINHPRVSDLVLHLVSPEGTRILLAENRGGLSTNGYGFSNLQTNVFPSTTSGGGSAAQTNTFGPVLTSGYININYQFFDQDPDRMQVYYDGRLIYDTGVAFGTNSVLIPYGPGVGTDIVVVMNPDGNANANTFWNYTLSVLSGEMIYATFSENTNLALVPIKFAIPPFATNLPADVVTFDSSYFESPTTAGAYSAPGTVDGWSVTTNSVDVIGNNSLAHRGTNFLAMGNAAGAVTGSDILAGPILNPANGHYYYLLASNTWTASEARALTLGGHLATINDAAEDAWIYSTFANYGGTPKALWTGLTDSTREGTFNWISGEMSAYRNWAPPEPNGYDAGEDYVHIFSGDNLGRNSRWNDYNSLSFIDYGGFRIPLHGVVEVNSVDQAAAISRTLPTTVGEFYTLKFAYRRSQPGVLSSANITLDGVFTNQFVGGPGWTVHSSSFTAPKDGTKLDIYSSEGGSFSPAPLVLVANYGNGFMRKYAMDGTDLGNFNTVPVPQAQGIAIDKFNNVYLVSPLDNNVRRFSSAGVDMGIFANTGLNNGRTPLFDANGNLYVANAGNGTVRRFSPSGVDLGNFISNGLSNPTGMAFDENGNLYVANYNLNDVKKFAPDGTFLGVAISSGLNQPIGLVIIPQGQGGGFYVANDFASRIIRYNAAGTAVKTLTSGSLGRLHYMTRDFAGNLYVTRHTGNAVRKFSPADQDLGDFTITGVNGPSGILTTPNAPSMWFDSFQLIAGGDPNYFLPEESLKTLIGQPAQGDWKLEVWDNRAGSTLGAAQLVSWQLHLTFASTAASATTVSNGVAATNTVSGSEIKYFVIDVPLFTTQATNVLVSGGGALNLLFNQEELPIGGLNSGDTMLLAGTVNGTRVLTLNTIPDLQPGRRYYLGVQNLNPQQTNFFTLTVTFDNTNNLVEVTPLTSGVPLSTNLPLGQSIQYYQYDVSSGANQVLFEVFEATADVDLVVRRGSLPTQSNYDFNSAKGGTNAELVDVNIASAPPLEAGRYYVGVYGFSPTNGISYKVRATEFASFAPVGEFFNSPVLGAGGVTFTAGTIPGETYQLQVSTNLVIWTVVETITATSNQTTFTDPTPPATQPARFYRLRQL